MRLATISCDDGHGCDGRFIELLNSLGITATFYLCGSWLDRAHTRVPVDKIRDRYRGHEVGNHTMTHPEFAAIPQDEWRDQILGSRLALRKFFDEPVDCFSYPFGAVLPGMADHVRAAGHRYGRTFRPLPDQAGVRGDPMLMPISRQRFWPLPLPSEVQPHQCWHWGGHSYELAENGAWDAFASFLRLLKAAQYEFVVNSVFWDRVYAKPE